MATEAALAGRLLRALALLLAVAAGAPATAYAQRGKEAPRLVFWEGELDAARTRARERNAPLLTLAILEAEEESDRFRAAVLGSRKLAETAGAAVVLLVNQGQHPLKKVEERREDGELVEREVCSAYGTRDCEVHRRNWDRVILEYTDLEKTDGEWKLPQALVIRPDGTLAARLEEGNPPPVEGVVEALLEAIEEAGRGLDEAQLVQARDLAEKAETRGRAADWPAAWRAAEELLALALAGPLHERGLAARAAAHEGMREALAAAEAEMVPGRARAGYPRLLALRDALDETPFEREARAAVTKAERDAALKEEIAAAKLDLEAEEIWTRAMELLREDKERGAMRVLARLAGEKYAETPAGKRVRERYPDLVPD